MTLIGRINNIVTKLGTKQDASKSSAPNTSIDKITPNIYNNCTSCKFYNKVNMEGQIDLIYGFGYCNKRILSSPTVKTTCNLWVQNEK